MVSAIEFRSAITRWAARRLPEASKIMQATMAFHLGRRIVRKTPVRTGLARGNMRLAIGKRVAERPINRRDPSGEAAIKDIQSAVSRLAPYSSYTIYNALPYIARLERGWSRQAPLGMFRLSLREIKSDMPNIVREVRKKLGTFIVK